MTQIDILLGQSPKQFDLTIGHNRSYDVILNHSQLSHNIYLYDLKDRTEAYGDELDPIIFRLIDGNADCLLNVSLLETIFPYQYDEDLFDQIDDLSLSTLGRNGGYNRFAIRGTTIDLSKVVSSQPKRQTIGLVTKLITLIDKNLDVTTSTFSLQTSGKLCNIADIGKSESLMRLTTKIISVLTQTCSLIANTQNTQISLESICGQVYLKISCNLKDALLSMHSSVPDFFTTITIQENMRSVMRFYANASFVYQLICSCQPLSSSLKDSELLVTMNAQVLPITADTKFTNQITKDIRRYSALGIAGNCKLSTVMTKELEMQYGLGYYDKRYLYQWDPYKLVDMSQQIVNQTYKVVSQRN